jgi:uncharacterized protein (TIGR02246 family)
MVDGGASNESLEERVRRLEDREEIRALLLEFGRRLDEKNFVGMSELFTETGEFAAPLGAAIGRAQIAQTLASVLSDIPAGYHYYSNTEIKLDGDNATTRLMFTYLHPDEESWPRTSQAGHYDDSLKREDGVWLFQRRDITRDMGHPPYKQ